MANTKKTKNQNKVVMAETIQEVTVKVQPIEVEKTLMIRQDNGEYVETPISQIDESILRKIRKSSEMKYKFYYKEYEKAASKFDAIEAELAKRNILV